MVQLLADPATGHTATAMMDSTTTTTAETTPSLTLWPSPSPAPANPKQRSRRGYSVVEFNHNHHHHHHHHHNHHTHASSAIHSALSGQVSTQAAIPENAVLRTAPTPAHNLPIRSGPGKKPPRRSYSATDKEPEVLSSVGLPQPSLHLGILDMPPELHYTLFDFLDPIDAVCLGLAHSKLYSIHRRKHARVVPLSTRYSGPNDMEWAWRGARNPQEPLSRSPSPPQQVEQPKPLEQLRVKGQVYCRKCGISRCELHRHLRSWMGEGYEYCEIKKRFGAPAGQDAKEYCFMSSPKDRHRCGRHGGVKSGVSSPVVA